jgi:hypothetical protein
LQLLTRDLHVVIWLTPLAMALFVYESTDRRISSLLALLVFSAGVVLVARRPGRGLVVLVTLLPFQLVVLSWLYARGLPDTIIRPLGNWKDVIVAGLVVAGIRQVLLGQDRLDTLDKLAIGYACGVAAYVFVPSLFTPDLPSSSSYGQLQGFRTYGAMALLFFGVRHAGVSSAEVRRALRGVVATAVVVSAIAVFEFAAPKTWDTFAIDTVEFPNYLVTVLRLPQNLVYDQHGHLTVHWVETIGGTDFTRVGSILFTPLILGWYLLVPFAITAVAVARGAARPTKLAASTLIALGLIVTITRSALIGAMVIGAIAIRGSPNAATRIRYAALAGVALFALAPFAAGAGLGARTQAAFQDAGSQQAGLPTQAGHVESLSAGVTDIVAYPLGNGPGTARYGGDQSYLILGTEFGVLTMVLFIAMLIAVLRALGRARPSSPLSDELLAIRVAGIGIAVASCLIFAWTEINTGWLFFGLAGAALGAADRERRAVERAVDPAQHNQRMIH